MQHAVVTLVAMTSLTVVVWQAGYAWAARQRQAIVRMLQLLKIWINSRTAKLPEVEGEIRRRRLDPVPLPVARGMTSSQERDCVRAIDALPRVPKDPLAG